MKYEEMVAFVVGETGLSPDAAEQSIVATLNVLAERVTASEMRDLLAQLPKAVRARVEIPPQPTSFTLDEFITRVEGIVPRDEAAEAEARVRASFAVLTEAVNAGEIRDIAEQLSDDYGELLGRRQADATGTAAKMVAAARGAASRPANAALDAVRTVAGVTSDLSAATLHRIVSPLPGVVTRSLRRAGAAKDDFDEHTRTG